MPERDTRQGRDDAEPGTVPLGHHSWQAPVSGWQPGAEAASASAESPPFTVPLPPPIFPTDAPPPERARRGLSRRSVLIGAGAGALGVGALGAGAGLLLTRSSPASSPGDIYASGAGQVAHLLRRAGFGPSPADFGEYLALGVAGSIERLLKPAATPDDLDARLAALHFAFTKQQEAMRWTLLRMLESKRPLEEKMTLFWHGVLTSSLAKVGGKVNYHFLVEQNSLLRSKALGRFDDLVAAITTDPAMLWWLDGRLSTGHNPNENFARELMELFTMGLDTYTQNDVHQAALALTGWTIRQGKSVFVPGRHYDGAVTFLDHTGKMGVNDVVKLVCAHPTTGKHIAFRMWSFFVSENPRDSDVKPLVDAYYSSNHQISAMVRAMLTSPAFTKAAYRARIKSPIEFVVGALRGLGLATDGTGLSAQLSAMGQVPLDPPDVSGWNGDKVSGAWISTQAWMARVNFINLLVAAATGTLAGGGVKVSSSGGASTAVSSSAMQAIITARKLTTPQDVADYYVAALVDNQLDEHRRAVLHDAITQQHASRPALTLAGGAKLPAAAARTMLYLLIAMPGYQLN